MKVRIHAKTLEGLIAAVSPACAKGTTITSGIHLEADDMGRLVATATSYETTIQAWAEVEVEDTGCAVMPSALFAKAIGTLPDAALCTLTGDDDRGGGVVEAGRARFELQGFRTVEWPADALEAPAGARRIDLPAKQIAAALRATVPFVSQDGSRPALCGVLLEVGRGTLRAVSTDGYRLGLHRSEVEVGQDVHLRAIVEKLAVAQVLAAIGRDSNAAPFIEAAGRQVAFVVGNTTIRSRVIESEFPDYTRVIPTANAAVALRLNRADLIASIARASALAVYEKVNDSSTIRMECDGSALHFQADSVNAGHSRDEMALFAGAHRFKCGINPAYLIQALRVIDAEIVDVQVSDQFSPILITADECPGLLHVCMPMRL